MTERDIKKIAEDYVMRHKEHYGAAPEREIRQAVDKVAKVLSELTARSNKRPPRKARAKAA